MHPIRFFTRLLALTTSLQLAGPAVAGEQPLALTFHDESSVAWVLVPVVVRDPAGYVKGLEAGDFELWVDERQTPFESFERELDAPMSLVYLQDLSGSMASGGKLEASREALSFFLERARPGDEFALATFASGSTRVEVPFTPDVSVLDEARALWRAWGTTALHDAVAWLPDIHTGSQHLKRAAILVSDGVDNASTITPEAARAMLHEARLPVFVLGLEALHRTPAEPAGETFSYARLLAQLAAASGGRYYEINDPDDLKEACLSIADELRHQYVLGFRTRGEGPADVHRLRVRVRGKGLTIAHRPAYRGTPPP